MNLKFDRYHDRKMDKLTVAHVGDSRSVLGKKKDESSPWESLELTTDHKPDLPKARMSNNIQFNIRIYIQFVSF